MTPTQSFRPLIAGFAAIVVSGCARAAGEGEAREAGHEAAQAVARVFETTEPYADRTVSQADIAAFLEKNAAYRGDSAAIADFYDGRSMQFAWILNGRVSSSAESFVTLAGLAEARRDGPARLRRLSALYEDGFAGGERAALCRTCATELELRLTAEFFRFAREARGGYVNTDVHDLQWFIPRARKNLAQYADSLAAGMDFGAYRATHPQFEQLATHVKTYAALADAPWPAITLPSARTRLSEGDSLAAVVEVRRRLHKLGDYSGDTLGAVVDTALVHGIERFQRRHGLTVDGEINSAFVRVLNVPPADRLRTLVLNMERLRWVSPRQPPNLLLVNIPEFQLHVFEGEHAVMSMAVVVGARATRTITFTDTLTQIVFSPSWGIPRSIVKNEILPAMAKDPDYLEKHDMEIVGDANDSIPQLRQRPGPRNPLGHVKFLFPNSYAIYMHDTPARGLFEHDERAASHGCIRLSKADALAEYLLRNDPEWPVDRIHKAMNGGTEVFVRLAEPRPVAIVYFTAWVDRDGLLNFRDDVYGHDAVLAGELFSTSAATARATASAAAGG